MVRSGDVISTVDRIWDKNRKTVVRIYVTVNRTYVTVIGKHVTVIRTRHSNGKHVTVNRTYVTVIGKHVTVNRTYVTVIRISSLVIFFHSLTAIVAQGLIRFRFFFLITFS